MKLTISQYQIILDALDLGVRHVAQQIQQAGSTSAVEGVAKINDIVAVQQAIIATAQSQE